MINPNNCTGRIFMCVGIDELCDDVIADSFETGKSYLEIDSDIDGINLCGGYDLLIVGNCGLPLYVNKTDFALMSMETTKFKNELQKK